MPWNLMICWVSASKDGSSLSSSSAIVPARNLLRVLICSTDNLLTAQPPNQARWRGYVRGLLGAASGDAGKRGNSGNYPSGPLLRVPCGAMKDWRYTQDVLAAGGSRRRAVNHPERPADPGLAVAHRGSDFAGRIVSADSAGVRIRDAFGRSRVFRYGVGAFEVAGEIVTLVRPRAAPGPARPALTASGSRAGPPGPAQAPGDPGRPSGGREQGAAHRRGGPPPRRADHGPSLRRRVAGRAAQGPGHPGVALDPQARRAGGPALEGGHLRRVRRLGTGCAVAADPGGRARLHRPRAGDGGCGRAAAGLPDRVAPQTGPASSPSSGGWMPPSTRTHSGHAMPLSTCSTWIHARSPSMPHEVVPCQRLAVSLPGASLRCCRRRSGSRKTRTRAMEVVELPRGPAPCRGPRGPRRP